MARSIKIYHWDFKVNSLWLWFYCLLVLAAEGYLMYRAIISCKDYNELPWSTQEKPVSELYVYIALIVISIMCVPFFVITSVFRIGSYSNDGTRLGRDNVLHHLNVETAEGASSNRSRFLKDMWRHIGPLCHSFHLIAGFMLLLPIVVIDAQKVRHGFLSPDKMWSSELDVLFRNNHYTLDSFVPLVSSNPQPMSPNTTTSQLGSTTPRTVLVQSGPTSLSPEYANYLLVMIIYSLRYAAVYWYTNAAFSCIFAFLLLLCTLHNSFAYCGMGVLYKFSLNQHAVENISLILSHRAVMMLYLLSCIVMFFSMMAIFNYGYCHYVESCRNFLKMHFPTYARYIAKMPVGCHGYVPHILATMSLVTFVGLRAPIVYDYVSLYRETGFAILLTCIVMDALYMILWIATWLGLTLKQSWNFQVNPQTDIVQQAQRTGAVSQGTQRQNGTVPQAEVTVLATVPNGNSYHGNHNGRQPPSGSSASTTSNNSNPSQMEEPNGVVSNFNINDNHTHPDIKQEPNNFNDINHSNNIIKPDQVAQPQPPPLATKPPKPARLHLPPLNILDTSQDSSAISNMEPKSASQQPQQQQKVLQQQKSNISDTNTPISPTSALKKSGLRKSGERRHNAPQRVTFDDSVDHIDNEVANINAAHDTNLQDTQQENDNRLSPDRKKKYYDNYGDISNSVYDQQNSHNHKKSNYDSMNDDSGEIPKKSTPNKKTSSGDTPENTLTRNYRSSLRDKCGQYYKHLGDLIPPAAQSSPLPNNRPFSDSFELSPEEILLNPLTVGGTRQQHSNGGTSSPAVVSKDYFHQRGKPAESKQQLSDETRLRDPRRLSGRKSNDDSKAYSYPPKLYSNNIYNNSSSNNQGYTNTDRYQPSDSSMQPNHNNFNSSTQYPLKNQQLLRPIQNDLYNPSPSPNHSNSTNPSEFSYPYGNNITWDSNNKPYINLNPMYSDSSPYKNSLKVTNAPVAVKPLPNHLKRQLEVNTKPDLDRRDSALPSSNETSSNESAENMLCSQV